MGQYDVCVRQWREWAVRTGADLDLRLDSFRILFAYNSGKIEDPEISDQDTREIFENGKVVGYSGSARTLFAQQNQKTCYEFLREKIPAKEPLSIPLVLETHRIIAEGTYDERRYMENGERPGEFRKYDYPAGVNGIGAYPDEVEDELSELIGEVNAIGTIDPLKAGAYFHGRFEGIRPFADGNGRVGRTLLNYWLMINDHPPVIIYDEDKSAYYEALKCFDEWEDLAPLVTFLEEQTVKTWAYAMGLLPD